MDIVERKLSVAEVLSKAADLIEQTGLAKGALARDADGEVVTYDSEDAVCFCGLGAVSRIDRDQRVFDAAWDAANAICPPTKPGEPAAFAHWQDNPIRTQEDVVAKLREAARIAALTPPLPLVGE